MDSSQQCAAAFAQSQPGVLILASTRWISTARLALAFDDVGCRVELLGARAHPGCVTGKIARRYAFNSFLPVWSLRRALTQSAAQIIIPADERMVGYLRELIAAETLDSPLRARLETALGGGSGFPELQPSRIDLMRLAAKLGIAIPETRELHTLEEVHALLDEWRLPLLLKADSTAGGSGVHVLNDALQAPRLWRKLRYPLSLPRALRRGIRFREWEYLRSSLRQEKRDIVAQKFVHGSERTLMAIAHRGKVLACVCFEVVHTWYVRGPSSVLRIVDDPELCRAAEKLCAALQTTGFFGLDFMIDRESGEALLIEMNGRPTQLAHLPLGPGCDLVAAAVRAIAGGTCADRPATTRDAIVALFPQELHRDPESEILVESFHDVPWTAPKLIRRALGTIPPVISDDSRWKG